MAPAPSARTHVPPAVARALESGAQVLTASARAARALGRAYAEDALAAGAASWRAPAIQDWASWLTELYRTLALESQEAMPLPLSTLQEELLWARVEAVEGAQVVAPERLARLAQSGYALLSQYQAHAGRRAPWAAAHEDAEHFLAWADAFEDVCTRLDVLPCAALESALQAHAGALRTLPQLLLVGFDRLTPAQAGLLRALDQAGVPHTLAPEGEPAAEQVLVCAADPQAELLACAQWVRRRLEADPGERIAVLVPELGSVHAELDRVFRRVLLPASGTQAGGGTLPYEFSLGLPLGVVPITKAALLLLRWTAGPLPAAEMTTLLLGSFLGGSEEEQNELALADATLRRRGLLTTELSLASFLRHAEQLPTPLPRPLRERLAAPAQWARAETGTRTRSYAEWAELAASQLAAAGWPGESLDSLAYQATKRWDALLGQLAGLSFAGDRVRWSECVQALATAAANTLFAAESRNAPVQVLGAAEASGQSFDAIWSLGANEGRWPAGGRMHPLLAPALQRDAGMPHATPDGDRELAAGQLRRIVASAPVVVCSYAAERDGASARPSPLLGSFAGGVVTLAAPTPLAQQPCAMERCEEPSTIAPWPAERVAGGSDVLKRQAACGFQSFARRLGAEPLEGESFGLDAADRATLLHRALEQLWSTEPVPEESDRLHTHDDLARAIGDGSIDEKLDAAVERSFRTEMREADSWRRRYLELEQQRLSTRLRVWLDCEQDRAWFKVVGLEQRMEGASIDGLRLNLRADRIDQTADGRRLVLDYKTAAAVSPRLWEGERPDEPQLPIYALFGGIEAVAGIAFGQIRPGKTNFYGVAEDPEAQLGGRSKTEKYQLRPEQWDAWDQALRSLAGQYGRGEAPVNPKCGQMTCRTCGLEGVCRVRQQAGAPPIALVEEEDDDG